MHTVAQITNPFALLTDPEAIFRALEASPRLESLNRRICRPLDRVQRDDAAAEGQESAILEAVIDQPQDEPMIGRIRY
jgi:hypothetical protein